MPQQEHCFSTYPHEKPFFFLQAGHEIPKGLYFFVKVCDVLSHISCAQLCDPVDCSPPGSSVHGMLQTRILEWGVMLSSGVFRDPGTESASPVSCTSRQVLYYQLPPGKACYTSNLLEVLSMSSCCWLNCIPFSLHWEAPVWGDISCWVPQMRAVSGWTMTGTATSL